MLPLIDGSLSPLTTPAAGNGYVSQLPACATGNAGQQQLVYDAVSPGNDTSAVTGSGTLGVGTVVLCNGTNWVTNTPFVPTSNITLTGAPTAGTATCSMSMQGTLKIATCYLNAYQETGTAQTATFPTAFSAAPVLLESGGSCGTYNPTSTATVLTLPANASMTAETCNIVAIGQ